MKDKEIRTEKELKQLAIDIQAGKVFGSWNIKNPDMISAVFPVTIMMEKKDLRKLQKRKVVHFFEYIVKAMPQSVNGMPIFFSCNFLTEKEIELLQPMINELKQQQNEFLGDSK